MKKPTLITCIFLFFIAPHAFAERWICQDSSFGNWSNILVIATSDLKAEIGTIKVAGTEYTTSYGVNGFDRRWNFGLNEKGLFDYAFVITPAGTGKYFSFLGNTSVAPSSIMHCKLKKKRKRK